MTGFLLVPAKPVPNGGLHLGHMSGPYLRLDILKKHLRRSGATVSMVFGTDPFDSFVSLQADRQGIEPRELSMENHARIERDLQSMGVEVDALINPVAPEWSERYTQQHLQIFEQLLRAPSVERRREIFPYSEKHSRYLSGGRILGTCPGCEGEVAGYFCEECCLHLQPSELLGLRTRDGSPFEWREVESVFLTVPNSEEHLQRLATTTTLPASLEIVRRFLDHSGRIRLTEPSDWGVRLGTGCEQTSLFLHGLLFAYCLLCGEEHSRLTGDVNPFKQESDTITVNGFGRDNIVTHMVGIQTAASVLPGYKPFNRFVVNYFLKLKGEKFSTSRRHVVWVSDATSTASSDVLRDFLSRFDLSHGEADFLPQEFESFRISRSGIELGEIVYSALRVLPIGVPRPASASFRARFESLLASQEAALSLEAFNPAAAACVVDEWIGSREHIIGKTGETYWWLKGFALLAYPITTTIACLVWEALGAPGDPEVSSFFDQTMPHPRQSDYPPYADAAADLRRKL